MSRKGRLPPGRIGLPILGDASVAFWRSPFDFVTKNMVRYGPIFRARVLNTPTTFVADYAVAKTLLAVPEDHVSASDGYRSFMEHVFGSDHVLLASDKASRDGMLTCLHSSLSEESVQACKLEFQATVGSAVEDTWVSDGGGNGFNVPVHARV